MSRLAGRASVKKEEDLWARGDPSPSTMAESWGAAGAEEGTVASGTLASTLRLPPPLELVTLQSNLERPEDLITCGSDQGILWGYGRKESSAEPGAQASLGVSKTKLHPGFIKQALPPPATVIRLGVAMVTGEVT